MRILITKTRFGTVPSNPLPHHSPRRTAAVAPPRSHLPPVFETPSTVLTAYPSDLQLPSKLSHHSRLSLTHLFSFFVVLLIFTIQVFKTPFELSTEPSRSSYYRGAFDAIPQSMCRKVNLFQESLPVSRPYKMSLLEEAKRVAAEFDYSKEDLNEGVKAFISQVRM